MNTLFLSLFIASDGLWDVLKYEDLVGIVQKTRGNIKQIGETLQKHIQDRFPGAHQYGREYGDAADKGINSATDELRRQQYSDQLCCVGGFAADRLGKPSTDEWLPRMSSDHFSLMGWD